MLDESGFCSVTEMGGFTLDKGPVFLSIEKLWAYIFTSSALVGVSAKRSVSDTFLPSGYPNTKPPTLLLLLLQSLKIQFSASLDAWIQFQQGGWEGGEQSRKRLEIGDTFMIT